MKKLLIAFLFVLLSLVSAPIGTSKTTPSNSVEAPSSSMASAQRRRYRLADSFQYLDISSPTAKGVRVKGSFSMNNEADTKVEGLVPLNLVSK